MGYKIGHAPLRASSAILPACLSLITAACDQESIGSFSRRDPAPPSFPLQIVLHRSEEVLACECDMASVHHLLSQIPQDLPYETLISRAGDLFVQFPPSELAREAAQQQAERSVEATSVGARCPLNTCTAFAHTRRLCPGHATLAEGRCQACAETWQAMVHLCVCNWPLKRRLVIVTVGIPS